MNNNKRSRSNSKASKQNGKIETNIKKIDTAALAANVSPVKISNKASLVHEKPAKMSEDDKNSKSAQPTVGVSKPVNPKKATKEPYQSQHQTTMGTGPGNDMTTSGKLNN